MSELSAPGVRIPTGAAVYVFSDMHGTAWGLAAALRQAGLTDADDNWVAPEGTWLVGLGDYIDRGRDSIGVLRQLGRLAAQAARADGVVLLLRGNHEAMALDGLRGDEEMLDIWLSRHAGGMATLEALGISSDSRVLRRSPSALAAAVRSRDPGFMALLAAMPEWATWRDVFLAHAGMPPGQVPEELLPGGDHLWQAPRYGSGKWDLDGPGFAAFRAAGYERIVYGHIPHASEAGLYAGGRALGIDTNACVMRLFSHPHHRGGAATVVRLPPTGSLGAAEFFSAATDDAPDRQRRE